MCDESVNFSTLANGVLKKTYVYRKVKQLKQEYPQINYAVVLAYVPSKKDEYDEYSDTMLL